MDKNYDEYVWTITMSSRQKDILQNLLLDLHKRLCVILEGDKIDPLMQEYRELEWKVKQLEDLKAMKKQVDTLLNIISK